MNYSFDHHNTLGARERMHMREESHTHVLVFWTKNKDCIEFSFTLYIFLLVVVSQSAVMLVT
jgi:hypothetical protein